MNRVTHHYYEQDDITDMQRRCPDCGKVLETYRKTITNVTVHQQMEWNTERGCYEVDDEETEIVGDGVHDYDSCLLCGACPMRPVGTETPANTAGGARERRLT
jgi:hypothetical protein